MPTPARAGDITANATGSALGCDVEYAVQACDIMFIRFPYGFTYTGVLRGSRFVYEIRVID
jgi:hypothetical protein